MIVLATGRNRREIFQQEVNGRVSLRSKWMRGRCARSIEIARPAWKERSAREIAARITEAGVAREAIAVGASPEEVASEEVVADAEGEGEIPKAEVTSLGRSPQTW